MLGLAASVGEVGVEPDAAVSFVLAYALMRVLMTGLYVRAWRHVPVSLRSFVVLYATGNALGAAVWLSSLLVPGPGRYAVWAVGLFVELLGPILAVRTLSNPRVSFHPRHIPERYGLFTIIVLGESVLAVAVGTADTNWEPSAVLTAAFGFVVAACIWWLYFDHVGSSGIELGPRPAFYWGYGHFAVYAGIAAFGVGTQLAIEAAAEADVALAATTPAGGYDLGARLVLAGGVALYLAGIAFVDRVNEGVAGNRAILVRLATAALLGVLAILGASLPPPAFVALVTLAVLALTVLETVREDPSSLGGT
jgi:low temperature requirement protein LtrA